MAFWNKDPGFGVESVETIEEILRDGRKDLPLFEDLGIEPLQADELDVLIKAGLNKRPWTCLFVFNLKTKLLAMNDVARKNYLKPEDEIFMKNPFKDLGWFQFPAVKVRRFFVNSFQIHKVANPFVESDKTREARMEAEREEHRKYRERVEAERLERERREAAEALKVREEARLKGFNSLTVKEQSKLGAGSYGSYIKLSDQYGVKVLRDYGRSSMDAVPLAYERITREVEDQRKARERLGTLVPEVYAIVPVEMDGHWYPGIVMEHVEGQPLGVWVEGKNVDKYAVLNQLNSFMHKSGVSKSDNHEYNVLVDKDGNYRVIDFGLGCHFDGHQDIVQQVTLRKAG